jgi:putative SOS response-associated peptidase YedK
VAPGQTIGIVINNGSQNLFISSRWDFVPFWAKEKKADYSMMNARAETVASSRSYKDAFVNHRCLTPSAGFHEWLKHDKIKIPHYARIKSKIPVGLACLYNAWKSPEGKEIPSCSIITTDANSIMAPIHNRMPVFLHENDFRLWMDSAEHHKEVLLALLKPFPSEEPETHRVTT